MTIDNSEKTPGFKYAIISDIHGNLEALEAVLADIEQERVDRILCLGDLVGYGPNPEECIDLAIDKSDIVIAGNHDWTAIGLTSLEYFNPHARIAIEWTIEILSERCLALLEKLPIIKRIQDKSIFLVHSTPYNPDEWNYIFTVEEALANFKYLPDRICLIGHSHVPMIIEQAPDGEIMAYTNEGEFQNNHRYIINVGSVGQPRDGNPDAGYAILENNRIQIKRVPYNIGKVQAKMRSIGLPTFLSERLAEGR
jgi:predicted phosphodiesterase